MRVLAGEGGAGWDGVEGCVLEHVGEIVGDDPEFTTAMEVLKTVRW